MTFDGEGKPHYSFLGIAVDCCGIDVRNFTPESWRDRIGVVFQDPILFAGTVHDNIAYGSPGVTRSDVEDAARSANCDFIWDLPQGFDTMSE